MRGTCVSDAKLRQTIGSCSEIFLTNHKEVIDGDDEEEDDAVREEEEDDNRTESYAC